MAANMTGMRVEGTTIIGTGKQGKRSFTPRAGTYGLVAALIVALMIGGAALHGRGASHPATAIPHAATGAQTRFLENNTTNLPNAVRGPVVVPSIRQRFLESNTTALPNAVTAAAPVVVTNSERRFLDRNTTDLPAGSLYPYAEGMTPSLGHPR